MSNFEQQPVNDESLIDFEVGNSLISHVKNKSDGLALVKDVSLEGRTLDRLYWLSSFQGVKIQEAIENAIAHEFYLQTHALLGSNFYEIERDICQKELIFS